MNLESDFLSFIKKNELFSKEHKLLLALSGGKDSVALFHLLKNTGFSFEVAHCNFQLRGEAADADEAFVKALCGDEIICHTVRFDTNMYAKSKAISIQMAARELRYAWFEEIRVTQGLDFILTAHHLNDRIETLLFNITKGTGPAGLKGMPLQTGYIKRPLLFCTLDAISAYLDAFKYVWREDSSNAETKYSRNRIRAKVIPALKEINPGLESTLEVNFARIEHLYDIFKGQLEEFEKQYSKNGFDIEYLQNLRGGMLLFEEYVKSFGFTFQQVEALFDGFKHGTAYFAGTHQIYVDRTQVKIEHVTSFINEQLLLGPGNYTIDNKTFSVSISKEKPSIKQLKNPKTIYLDNSKISWPLVLRKWANGDTFKPYGMKGNKLISDYLIDSKLDMVAKAKQLVLADQDKIIHLVGLRASEDTKIEAGSVSIVCIEIVQY